MPDAMSDQAVGGDVTTTVGSEQVRYANCELNMVQTWEMKKDGSFFLAVFGGAFIFLILIYDGCKM